MFFKEGGQPSLRYWGYHFFEVEKWGRVLLLACEIGGGAGSFLLTVQFPKPGSGHRVNFGRSVKGRFPKVAVEGEGNKGFWS